MLTGDALERLQGLADESVQCCITSPPYYGLRDYGTGEWVGGDPGCDHRGENARLDHSGGRGILFDTRGEQGSSAASVSPMRSVCRRCGAERVDQQLGLEDTPGEYVERLVEVFREVRRVLRADGTVWLNLGDSYASASTYNAPQTVKTDNEWKQAGRTPNVRAGDVGLKAKDLVGFPWMVAFALRADGWFLRSDIIWAKPNPMPESVTDRPTRSHEYVFLLAKQRRYFYDADAIREDFADERMGRDGGVLPSVRNRGGRTDGFTKPSGIDPSANGGRNRRTVWEVTTQPYPGAHFATYPERLVEPMILAGTAARACSVCGTPWKRHAHTEIDESRPRARQNIIEPQVTQMGQGTNGRSSDRWGHWTKRVTDGFTSGCEHDDDGAARCVVLDPFAGSGTTGVVALRHGRAFIGVELSAEFAELARWRIIDDSPLFNQAAEVADS